jgi:hypothetical protein
MRRLKGLNSTAITSVETTTASWGCCSWSVRARIDSLSHRDAPEIECDQHGRERAVDQGAVYDNVYVVEAVLQDREAYSVLRWH